MLCCKCIDSQTTAYLKYVDSSQLLSLKSLLQTNSNSSVNKKKEKLTKKTSKQTKIYIMKIEIQNSIVRFSFSCRVTDIKIAWINTWTLCICAIGNLTFPFKYITHMLLFLKTFFLALGWKLCYQSLVELSGLYVPYIS